MNESENDTDVVLNTLPMKITLAFNSQFKITDTGDVENGVEFTYSLISANPVLANVANSSKFKYPYFTNNVMYPEDVILKNGPVYAMEFFFDKERFEQVLLKYAGNTYVNDIIPTNPTSDSAPDSDVLEALSDNATFNVNLMLKVLLPISSEFGYALTSSFHRYIKQDYMTNIFPSSAFDVERLFNSPKWLIQAEGKQQYVQNVIWASSILDNPNYFYFLYVYNNSLVRRRKLRDQATNDYKTRILGFLKNLRIDMLPNANKHADKKNLFDLLKDDIINKIKARTSSTKTEYDDMLHSIKTELMYDKTKNTSKLSDILNSFLGNSYFMKGRNVLLSTDKNDVDVVKVNTAIDTDADMADIQKMINAIIRIHVIIHEYRESTRKSTTGLKQLNLESQVASFLDQSYRNCIQVKSMKYIKRFIDGQEQFMDLNTKTSSGAEKSVEELDVIKTIETANAQYRELNDAIRKGMQNVFPPNRRSSNGYLTLELRKIKIKNESKTDASTSNDSCILGQKENDFFRDVYSRYFYDNKGYGEFDLDTLFTGVTILNSEGARNFEIFVVVDTLDKTQYDEADGAKCRVKEDNLTNALLNAISTKSKDKIGFVRNHDSLNAAKITKTQTQEKQRGGTLTRRSWRK